MNLENWTVAGRRFGILIIWLLMAGEIYTTFTFLGASGWAYSKGAPTYYIIIYVLSPIRFPSSSFPGTFR
jgi:SSS family solute:Na+ symporter